MNLSTPAKIAGMFAFAVTGVFLVYTPFSRLADDIAKNGPRHGKVLTKECLFARGFSVAFQSEEFDDYTSTQSTDLPRRYYLNIQNSVGNDQIEVDKATFSAVNPGQIVRYTKPAVLLDERP